MIELKKLTTEGDCEGRSTKNLGIFCGTDEQIITYCLENGIKEYYNFNLRNIDIIDVTGITPKVSTSKGNYGNIKYNKIEGFEKEIKRKKALSKLSDEEKEILGL